MCRSWWSVLSCVLCYNVPELVVRTELCAVLPGAGAGGLY